MVMESKIRRAIRDPSRIPRALLRRLLPRHPRFGYPWIHNADGSITFHERGFVSADSPALLLARHNFETRRIDQLLSGRKFEDSLEIGCGFGRLTPVFARHSQTHTAIDINATALEIARATYPGFTFEASSADDLPFDDDSFDLVTTWTVLQHIPPAKIEGAAREIQRVLRPRGVLLICEETRYPDSASDSGHTWHRRVTDYESLLAPMALMYSAELDDIDRLPGIDSPGRVMLWE